MARGIGGGGTERGAVCPALWRRSEKAGLPGREGVGPSPSGGGCGQADKLGQNPVLGVMILILQVFAFRLTVAFSPLWISVLSRYVCVSTVYGVCVWGLCVHAAQPTGAQASRRSQGRTLRENLGA